MGESKLKACPERSRMGSKLKHNINIPYLAHKPACGEIKNAKQFIPKGSQC